MNDLESYFLHNNRNLIRKWGHYFEIYERHFARYRGTDVHVLEFGVFHGGSLQMWKEYFGPNARIYGVDINPNCKQVEEDRIQVFIGDQGDRQFLRSLVGAIPRVDIVIDDGSHKMNHQIATFEVLFPHLDAQGIYLCEDTHTSYQFAYQGGCRRRNTFIEFSKNWVDHLHAWHSEQPQKLTVSNFTRTTHSVHYYPQIVVIEKKTMVQPEDISSGHERVKQIERPRSKYPPVLRRIGRWFRAKFRW